MIMIIIALIALVALLDGVNNAASFVSIAIGTRAVKISRVLLYASLGDFMGAISLGPLVCTRIMDVLSYDVNGVNRALILVGLVLTLAWLFYTTFSKAIAPVSVALLGLLIGIVSCSSIELYLVRISTYLLTWMAQIIFSSIFTLFLLWLHHRSRLSIETLTILSMIFIFLVILCPMFNLDMTTAMLVSLPLTIPFALITQKKNMFSIILPLFTAALAHGMNDTALMMSIIRVAISDTYNDVMLSTVSITALLGLTIACGVYFWAQRLSVALARNITLIETGFSKTLYTAIFVTTAVFNLLGFPAPITFSTLGSFIGMGLKRRTAIVSPLGIARLILIALMTIVIISMPLRLISLALS